MIRHETSYSLQEKELVLLFQRNLINQHFMIDFVELFEKTNWGPRTYICECVDEVIVNVRQDLTLSKMETEVFSAMLLYSSGFANGNLKDE